MSSRFAGVDTDEVLTYIEQYRNTEGYPPSRREIAEHFEIGLETTQRMLGRMIEEGILVVKPGVSRAINITGAGMKIITEDLT